MEQKTLAHGTFIVALTPEEWERILAIDYAPGRKDLLLEAEADGRCWLPGSIGQLATEYINRRWKEEGLPYRLVSEKPSEPWRSPTKRLRMQFLEPAETKQPAAAPFAVAR